MKGTILTRALIPIFQQLLFVILGLAHCLPWWWQSCFVAHRANVSFFDCTPTILQQCHLKPLSLNHILLAIYTYLASWSTMNKYTKSLKKSLRIEEYEEGIGTLISSWCRSSSSSMALSLLRNSACSWAYSFFLISQNEESLSWHSPKTTAFYEIWNSSKWKCKE